MLFLPPLLLLLAYLLGSIPFSFIVVRMIAGDDIRRHGSGNVGATNVARTFGKLPGIVALVLDAGKGWAATALAVWMTTLPEWPYHYQPGLEWPHSPTFWIGAAALTAVLGHVFPIWLNFRGGKGVATAAGTFLVLAPAALGVAFILFALTVAVTRYISLASILAAASLPVFVRFSAGGTLWLTVFSILIAAVVVLKHHENVARLARGEERRFPR